MRNLKGASISFQSALSLIHYKMIKAMEKFPMVSESSSLFSLLMDEDVEGKYDVAGSLQVSIVLATTENIASVVKPDLESVDYVFFVSNHDLRNVRSC